jgi:hypothetical protein
MDWKIGAFGFGVAAIAMVGAVASGFVGAAGNIPALQSWAATLLGVAALLFVLGKLLK